MAAGAVATPDVSAGGDVFSEIGSILSGDFQSSDPGTETKASPAESPVADSDAESTPLGEGPTSPEPGATPSPETPLGEGPTSEFQLNEDGSAYLVPKDQFAPLNGFKQYATEVQGIFPTASDAKVAQGESSDLRAMHADFLQGQPEDIDAFLRHFAGDDYKADPAMQAQFQQAFVRMADRVPSILKNLNPEAHSKFASGIVKNVLSDTQSPAYTELSNSVMQTQITNAYDEARVAADYATQSGMDGDKQYADLMLKKAQYMDWASTGQYKQELPKVDPNAKALQEAEAAKAATLKQQQDLEARETSILQRDFKNFNETTLDGPKWQSYWAEIDKTLAPVKDRYNAIEFDAIKERVNKLVVDSLQKDYDWARNHNNERRALEEGYKALWKGNQNSAALKPRIQAYQTDFMARVRRAIPSIAAPLLKNATASAVAASRPAASRTAQPPQQQQPRAAAPQSQPNNQQKAPYNIFDDPEFNNAFKVPGIR